MSPEKKKKMMETMMPMMLEGMSSEDIADMMSKMIPNIKRVMGSEKPEKIKDMMSKMMPEMMKGCMKSMGSGDMMDTMQEMMPKMMENCLMTMTIEEKKNMFTFCHTILRDMVGKFLQK